MWLMKEFSVLFDWWVNISILNDVQQLSMEEIKWRYVAWSIEMRLFLNGEVVLCTIKFMLNTVVDQPSTSK